MANMKNVEPIHVLEALAFLAEHEELHPGSPNMSVLHETHVSNMTRERCYESWTIRIYEPQTVGGMTKTTFAKGDTLKEACLECARIIKSNGDGQAVTIWAQDISSYERLGVVHTGKELVLDLRKGEGSE